MAQKFFASPLPRRIVGADALVPPPPRPSPPPAYGGRQAALSEDGLRRIASLPSPPEVSFFISTFLLILMETMVKKDATEVTINYVDEKDFADHLQRYTGIDDDPSVLSFTISDYQDNTVRRRTHHVLAKDMAMA